MEGYKEVKEWNNVELLDFYLNNDSIMTLGIYKEVQAELLKRGVIIE